MPREMNEPLPNGKNITQGALSIGEAARELGVSIQTLRRWDESGQIWSFRPDGKNRFFPRSEIERVKFQKKLSITDAATHLNLSPTTLRRLEQKGILVPQREPSGERVYERINLEKFKSSEHYQAKTTPVKIQPEPMAQDEKISQITSELKKEDEEIHELFGFRRKALVVTFFGILISFVLVSGLTFAFLERPQQTSEFMGYKDASGNKLFESPNIAPIDQSGFNKPLSKVLGTKTSINSGVQNVARSVLSPFSRVALVIVEKVDPAIYRQVAPRDINDIFAIDEDGKLITSVPLDLEGLGTGIINADFLRGMAPGSNEGDIAYFSDDGVIDGLILPSSSSTTPMEEQEQIYQEQVREESSGKEHLQDLK
ncbi:MAG: MerR family DNA-binding transcriptional regulator [Candidatus Levybacteria bacterium]|nr:MerR family DNA-binding transcriptional regulator [Candidatus Levybacteria bacterium]